MAALTPQAREDIQGIILSGYGHLYYTSYLFVQIQDAVRAKAWLQTIIPEISTAKPWPQKPDGATEKPAITLNIAFTYSGLQVFNLPQYTLDTFPREFSEGMTAPFRSRLLGDTEESAPEYWDVGGTNNAAVHILFILYGLNPEQLQQRQHQLLSEQDTGVVLVAQEAGYRTASNKEHFGFNDSISQPQIEGDAIGVQPGQSVIKTGEFILGYLNEYDFFPSTPVVPKEQDRDNQLPSFPGTELSGCKDFGSHGTYFVYRKLAQNVARFWQFMAQQGQNPEILSLIAAKFVGRWPSGTPLTLAPDKDNPQIRDKNQFTYFPQDRKGFGCPVSAHIRRTNPRDSFPEVSVEDSLKASNRHRLLRRGTLFGEPLFPPDDVEKGQLPLEIEDDGQPRGLHFFCINADIGRQFEFVQQTWVDNAKFNALYDNKDPLMGDNNGSGHMEIPRQLVRQRILNMPRFVAVKGGGYFFLPSLAALRFLVNAV